jgi:hypothetical protein
LAQCSDLVATGGKAEVQTRARNVAIDPERRFATLN